MLDASHAGLGEFGRAIEDRIGSSVEEEVYQPCTDEAAKNIGCPDAVEPVAARERAREVSLTIVSGDAELLWPSSPVARVVPK